MNIYQGKNGKMITQFFQSETAQMAANLVTNKVSDIKEAPPSLFYKQRHVVM